MKDEKDKRDKNDEISESISYKNLFFYNDISIYGTSYAHVGYDALIVPINIADYGLMWASILTFVILINTVPTPYRLILLIAD